MSRKVYIALSEARALEIAIDELTSYVDTIDAGDEDDAKIRYAIKILRQLLDGAGYQVPDWGKR